MEKQEYAIMFRLEEDYWWYRGLRDLVSRFVSRLAGCQSSLRLLDAGAGTGKLLSTWNGCDAYGLEFSEDAFSFLKSRGLENVVRASVGDIPFKNKIFHLITSLDVLYHAAVENDEDALVEIHRVLKSGGWLILNLPAFEFLRSGHDLAVHTRRRYQIRELRRKLERAGFRVRMITYRNTLLFPIAVAVRLLKRARSKSAHEARSDLRPLPAWANTLLYRFLVLENVLLFHGLTFPFGLSVFCLARKE